ncbi:MAG: cytochrome c oxidase subunit 3 [Saprospiraceae bacterium]|nr:cytochrome c oxidase subunit 3 [Candidatus Opimibacter iunctus]
MATETGERRYSVHPSSMMMVLILCGITTLFGALSLAYVYSRAGLGMFSISIPWLFLVNTLVLASTGWCIEHFRKYYHLREEKLTIRWGFLTLGTTLLFLIMQGIAWHNLLTHQITPGSSGGYGFLYAISILHFLHVSGGIPFLLRILIPLAAAHRQGSASLLFIDDHVRRKLRHVAWYWHFIDGVWILLMGIFIISSFF